MKYVADRPIACPECGDGHTHPVRVVANRGGRITTVEHARSIESLGRASGRGVRIEVCFVCESGHGFTQSFQFHKGTTYVAVERNTTDDHDGCDRPATLWRD